MDREVAALVLLKGSGALLWAAADVLNVQFAAMPSMQTLGNQELTLGFIFASVRVCEGHGERQGPCVCVCVCV